MGDLNTPPLTHMLTRDSSDLATKPGKGEPTEAFKWLRGHHDRILEYQFSIARWLMASLLVINGAALVTLPAVAEKHVSALQGAPWFIGGLVTAVLGGAAAWFNCNCITAAIDHRTNWDEVDYQDSDSADRYDRLGFIVAWISIAAFLLSLAVFTVGAIQVQKGAAKQPPMTINASEFGM